MFDLVGIGSALVDITIEVEDSFLNKQGLPKGGMTLIDLKRSEDLLSHFSPSEMTYSAGGATANVIASFANCGGKAAFIGKTGNDNMGVFFQKETEKTGATFLRLTSALSTTGHVFSFITPDKQRTFATYLGAASEMIPDDLTAGLLNQAPLIHVEAYLVYNRELIDFILNTATSNGQKISFDFSSFNVVQQNIDFFKEITKNNIDIIFANEEECLAFTGLPPESSVSIFKDLCETAAIKNGGKGSFLANCQEELFIPAEKVEVIDTNGAGDAYAGGILFGLTHKNSLKVSGMIGNKAGALMVSQHGARLKPENVQKLKRFISDS